MIYAFLPPSGDPDSHLCRLRLRNSEHFFRRHKQMWHISAYREFNVLQN